MGIYNNMQGVPGFGRGGVYTEPGTYEVTIDNLFMKPSRNPEKEGELVVICEWKFVKSSCEKHAIGSSGSVARTIKPDPYGYTANDVIRLVYAACKAKDLGVPDPEVFALAQLLATAITDPDEKERASAAKQLAELEIPDACDFLRGARVALEVVKGPTKKGGTFSYHNWSPATT